MMQMASRLGGGIVLLWVAASVLLASEDRAVFESVPAEHIPVIAQQAAPADAPMRTLLVEERMGVPRKDDLVRVPLFFHAGECADPSQISIYAADDAGRAKPITFQPDDIRRAADGSVARMHVYFFTDLAAWERKSFVVLAKQAPTNDAPLPLQQSGADVTLKGDDIAVTFRAKGPQAGGIVKIDSPTGVISATDAPLGPNVKLIRQGGAKGLDKTRENVVTYSNPEQMEVRQIQYATGPVLAKLRVRIGPKGVPDSIESTYLIPRRGSYIVASHRMMPDEAETTDTVSAIWPAWLQGRAKFGDDPAPPRQVKIPAGVRKLTREVHGFYLEAAASDQSKFSFMNVPEVVWGDHGVYAKEDGELVFMGPGYMKRNGGGNSGTIRSWWFGLRYVLAPTTDPEALYTVGLQHMQPLTAIVDEPAITIDDLQTQSAELAKRFNEIQYWGKGWQQTAAIAYMKGSEEWWRKPTKERGSEPKKPAKNEFTQWESYTPKWVREQLAAGGTWPLKRPKGSDKDVGQLVEPYPVGYAMGSIPVLARLEPSDRIDQICYAVAKASMWTNGGLYKNGFPRINAFSNAYNMQIGSVLFGLYAGKQVDDPELVRFYRDVTRSPGAIAIYGRGLRCYSSDVRQHEQSDLLYQAISDLWLRTAELTTNEDLMLHPTVFGRYSDAVDVTADLQHRPADQAPGAGTDVHANFFRTQAHDHRWESWDAAPFLQMLRDPTDAKPAGLTDAVYFVHQRAQGKVNWSELMNYFHALAMVKDVRQKYQPPTLPALPENVQRSAADGGVRVTWSAVPGATGYRVYRATREGEPLTLVNSPYGPDAKPLITDTHYTDANGTADDFYFVTAFNAAGYESHWFPSEPKLTGGN